MFNQQRKSMKKISTFLLAGAAVFGLAACNNEKGTDTPDVPTTGTSAVSLLISETSTRVSDGQADAEGVGGESKVVTGAFFAESREGVPFNSATAFTTKETPLENYWQTEVFEATAGKDLKNALILNPLASETLDANAKYQIADLANLVSAKGFTMSSYASMENNDPFELIEIKPNVKKTEVGPSNNQFDFTVERVAAKAQVAIASDASKMAGTFENYRWSLAGSAKESYVYRNHAGDRVLSTDGTKGILYKNFKSAIHETAATAAGATASTRPLTKVSDEANANVVAVGADGNWATLRSLPLEEEATANDYQSKSATKGIYFLENSAKIGFDIDKDNTLGFGDFTYVKVYGTYTPAPAELYYWDETANAIKVAADATKRDELLAEGVRQIAKWNATDSKYDFTNSESTYTKGTFFYGTKTRRIYASHADAVRAGELTMAKDGEGTIKQYGNGVMTYMTLANRQLKSGTDATGDALTGYADTRRNNIYSLLVSKITELGYNYDPVDPTDPNNPKDDPNNPTNPDEPEVPGNPPVDKFTTNIQVRAAILKWNLVHRNVEL